MLQVLHSVSKIIWKMKRYIVKYVRISLKGFQLTENILA